MLSTRSPTKHTAFVACPSAACYCSSPGLVPALPKVCAINLVTYTAHGVCWLLATAVVQVSYLHCPETYYAGSPVSYSTQSVCCLSVTLLLLLSQVLYVHYPEVHAVNMLPTAHRVLKTCPAAITDHYWQPLRACNHSCLRYRICTLQKTMLSTRLPTMHKMSTSFVLGCCDPLRYCQNSLIQRGQRNL